jgi:hypothetical protein
MHSSRPSSPEVGGARTSTMDARGRRRLAPSRALPPYAWRRGLPHPTRDPAGHSFAESEPPSLAGAWHDCEAFRFGRDLLANGYAWEAHEAWEDVWRSLPSGSAERDLVQALILRAAAAFHEREGRTVAGDRALDRARVRLARAGVAELARRHGIDELLDLLPR